MRAMLALVMTLVSLPSLADWQLDPAKSSLHFVTTKASHVAEVHQFHSLQGKVNDQGHAELSIDLASVDTKIEIRDQRMREMLFEVAKFPVATLTANIDPMVLAIKVGESKDINLDGKLSIHGQSVAVQSPARVERLSDKVLQVNSLTPVIVNAKDADLIAGIEKLREVAGLPSISYSVVVDYNLTFTNN